MTQQDLPWVYIVLFKHLLTNESTNKNVFLAYQADGEMFHIPVTQVPNIINRDGNLFIVFATTSTQTPTIEIGPCSFEIEDEPMLQFIEQYHADQEAVATITQTIQELLQTDSVVVRYVSEFYALSDRKHMLVTMRRFEEAAKKRDEQNTWLADFLVHLSIATKQKIPDTASSLKLLDQVLKGERLKFYREPLE